VPIALIAAASSTSSSKALWYLTRGTGLVAMILLSASVVLGVLEINRWASPAWPRFVTAGLHKNVSLLAVAFVAVHVATTVVDGFAPIGWLDAVVPLHSPYRPIWLGLGAVATDLLIAVTLTSLLRRRIGYRAWRIVHWSAYAAWPVAVVHGLGTGSDSSHGWALAVYAACLVAVAGSVLWRVTAGWTSGTAKGRLVALAGSLTVPSLIVIFLSAGPLQPGWAARAGTPRSLIAAAHRRAGSGSSATGTTTVPATSSSAFRAPFQGQLQGTLSQSPPDANGDSTVAVQASISGQVEGVLHLALTGPADPSGGITMNSSTAAMGPSGQPSMYQGRVTTLDGDQLQISLRDSAGATLSVTVQLSVDGSGGVSGSIQATA
jgi:sulfoxide reductase heme-binding subunit YedZ